MDLQVQAVCGFGKHVTEVGILDHHAYDGLLPCPDELIDKLGLYAHLVVYVAQASGLYIHIHELADDDAAGPPERQCLYLADGLFLSLGDDRPDGTRRFSAEGNLAGSRQGKAVGIAVCMDDHATGVDAAAGRDFQVAVEDVNVGKDQGAGLVDLEITGPEHPRLKHIHGRAQGESVVRRGGEGFADDEGVGAADDLVGLQQ